MRLAYSPFFCTGEKKMNKSREIRTYPVKEFRAVQQEDGVVLAGYSAVFDSPSENLGWGDVTVREKIAPGAFAEVLQSSDCRALFNHDANLILGRQSAGTLTLKEDERGLFSEIRLPETSLGRDLAVSVARGDISQQSFAFTVAVDEWQEDRENKILTRTIHKIGRLYDISPVTYPAYGETTVAKRSFDAFLQTTGVSGATRSQSQRLSAMAMRLKVLRGRM